jgi:AraC family transcriptional regulator
MQATARLEPGAFFGHSRRVRYVSDVILSETHYPAALEVPPHVHEHAYFALLLRGGYREDLGRGGIEFSPFSVVFHPPREVQHGDIGRQGATLFHVELPRRWTSRLADYGRIPDEAVLYGGGPMVRLAHSLYRELRADDAAAMLIAEGQVLEMLGLLARWPRKPERRAPRWLEEAVELVHEEFTTALTVRAIAERVGASAVHLARTFRRLRGESIGECVRRLRVERARRMLEDPSSALATIALEAGFADQSHFTRTFRRVTGFTPREYRRLTGRGAL